MAIHPTAIVDKSAEIEPTVDIGAYAVVERGVHIGAGTRIWSHGYVAEGTTLGANCQVHPFAVVGHLPQDVKYKGEPSYTRIGDGTLVREHATIHRGTMPGSTTIVGNNCFIMSTGHIGHNCVVGSHVVIANGGLLAGHVEVGDRAFISGCAVVHQFTRIGELAMLGGGAVITADIPPFLMVVGRMMVTGPNVVGLRRAGLSSAERLEIREIYRKVFRSGRPLRVTLNEVAAVVQTAPGRRLVEFLRTPSKRGIAWARGASRRPREDEEVSVE